MTDPIEQIRKGIETNDMDLVSEGFDSLTQSQKEDKPAVSTSEDTSYVTSTRDNDSSSSKTGASVGEVIDTSSKRENLFVDDRTESLEDIEIDKKLSVKPLVQRSRKQFQKVTMVCGSCRKKIEVSPALARENYICDQCLVKRR